MEKIGFFTHEQKLKFDLRKFPVRPHIGGGGVIRWNKHILMIKRKYDPGAGKWSIPGGHLELGETVIERILRECNEETGLEYDIGDLAGVINRIDNDEEGKLKYHYVLIDHFLTVKGDYSINNPPRPIAQSDVELAEFIPIDKLPALDLTYSVVDLFKQLKIM